MKEKRIINTKTEFKICQKRLTEEDFFNRFECSIELTTTLMAEDGMKQLQSTDRALTAEELKNF